MVIYCSGSDCRSVLGSCAQAYMCCLTWVSILTLWPCVQPCEILVNWESHPWFNGIWDKMWIYSLLLKSKQGTKLEFFPHWFVARSCLHPLTSFCLGKSICLHLSTLALLCSGRCCIWIMFSTMHAQCEMYTMEWLLALAALHVLFCYRSGRIN